MASWRKVITSGSDANLKSLVVSQSLSAISITGSLLGTASFADFTYSSSYVTQSNYVTQSSTASYVEVAQTASFVDTALTASYVNTARTASYVVTSLTASFVDTALTASFVNTARTASFVDTARSASFVTASNVSGIVAQSYTASYVVTAQTASFVVTALTASFVDTARTASLLAGTASQAFTASYITGSLFTNSNSAATASFAQTASYVVTAQTASRVTGSNVIGIVAQSYTASFVTGSNVIGIVSSASLAAGIPTAGMVWNAVGGTPTGYGGSILGNAAFQDNDAGVKLTPNSVGQTGTVNWNLTGSNAFDFTKDFRASFATYYQGTAGTAGSGDGHYFYFGGNKTTLKSYGDVDASLTIRYEPYIDGSGSYAYVNGSEVAFNRFFYMGVGSISNAWVNWIIEVKTVPVLAKRFATLYWSSELWPLLQADVTSWTPGGKTFGVGAWTGAAFANQWCKSAKLQYI